MNGVIAPSATADVTPNQMAGHLRDRCGTTSGSIAA